MFKKFKINFIIFKNSVFIIFLRIIDIKEIKMEKQNFINLKSVCSLLAVSRSTVLKLEKSGDLLPSLVLPSGHRRYSLNSVEEFIQKYSTKKENEKENPTDQ